MASWQCMRGKIGIGVCLCPDCMPEPTKCNSVCCCARCDGGEQKFWYRVKPFDWANGHRGFGRTGTSYVIEQVRAVATSKCLEDANMIAEALNTQKKLKARVEALEGQALGAITPALVREVMIGEVSELPHCRRSSHRKQIVAFGNSMLLRLGLTGNIDRTSAQ